MYSPTVIQREDDNYEIELSRVREKIRAQFGDLTDRLKCRERELLEELDVILASYRSYQNECEIVRDRVRDLEMMKQRNEEELATSRSKNLQENFIKQIVDELKTIVYPEEPQLVSFVCQSNVISSEIVKLGKLVKEVTERAESCLRKELNTLSSTLPNSFSTKWESFEAKVSKTISTVLLSSPKTTYSYSSSKRLSQPTTSSSYKFDKIFADTAVNDLTRNLSRTETNSSKIVKASDTIHYTDFVSTGVYHDFSTYSIHGFTLDGEYWRSVQHYFQAQKYSAKWLRDEIRFAATSKKANEIGEDKTNRKNIVKNWDSIQEEVMFKALKAKFLNHVSLRDSLLATGDRLIVNDSENEFWGCGKDGKGNNKLGVLLMRIRSECLKAVDSKSSLPTNHTNTSYSYSPTSPLKCASSPDVIEFYNKDKPYFEFTPYSRHSVFLDDFLWNTLNHYFQAQKFTSNNEKRKIKDAPTADRATYIANNELKWLTKKQTFDEKEIIMKRGLEAKFTQHPDLRRMLLDTGTSTLLFIHPEDVFWGIGTSKSKGKNKLGELLMNLRNKLQVPSPSTEPKFDPKNILHTNSYPCSSYDDNTTHQRNVKRQVSSPNKLYSTPPTNVDNNHN